MKKKVVDAVMIAIEGAFLGAAVIFLVTKLPHWLALAGVMAAAGLIFGR